MSCQDYILPDLLRDWPWARCLSPFYLEAKQQSNAWVQSFQPFSRRGQKALEACDLNLLASLTYSNRHKEFVRVGCDLMNFYFVYDEYTDVSDPLVAEELATIVIEQMKDDIDTTLHPHSHNHVLGGMTREFWKRAKSLAKPGSACFNRFVNSSETYLRAVTQEAKDRADKRVRSIEEYMILRRDTCGARPTLALIEFGLDLPEEVTSHPVMVSLLDCAVDLIICVNDMHSYVREQSCGLADHNILTPIMREHNLGLQDALDWLWGYTTALVDKFNSDLERIPSWGPEVDDSVQTYIEGLGQWIRGNDDWSCESKRYYGNDGLRVKDTRVVSLKWQADNYLKMEDSTDTPCSTDFAGDSSSQPSLPASDLCASRITTESDRTIVEDETKVLRRTRSVPVYACSYSSSATYASAERGRLKAIRAELSSWWAAITRTKKPKEQKLSRVPTSPSHSTASNLLSSPSQWRLNLSFTPSLRHKKHFISSSSSFLDVEF